MTADDEADDYPFYLLVVVPLGHEPVDRARVEDVLEAAIGDLGDVLGGGTSASVVAGATVLTCDIVVAVHDLERALPILLATLRALALPAGTILRHLDDTGLDEPI
jgi:hypothetical protein